MFEIKYRNSQGRWVHWITVSGLINVVNEKRKLLKQGFDVLVLNANGDVIS